MICRLQWAKDPYIAGLKFVRRVRWESTENDIVLVAKFQDLERLMRAKIITD